MIIALGTGRCGSVSFANHLNTFHEFKPIGTDLVWTQPPTDEEFQKFLDLNQAWAKKYKKTPGDASMGHIWAIERWIDYGADIYLLMRDRDETVRSLQTHRTKGIFWNRLFPEFDFTKESEMYRYWDWYYDTALQYEEHLKVISPYQLPVRYNESIVETD